MTAPIVTPLLCWAPQATDARPNGKAAGGRSPRVTPHRLGPRGPLSHPRLSSSSSAGVVRFDPQLAAANPRWRRDRHLVRRAEPLATRDSAHSAPGEAARREIDAAGASEGADVSKHKSSSRADPALAGATGQMGRRRSGPGSRVGSTVGRRPLPCRISAPGTPWGGDAPVPTGRRSGYRHVQWRFRARTARGRGVRGFARGSSCVAALFGCRRPRGLAGKASLTRARQSRPRSPAIRRRAGR